MSIARCASLLVGAHTDTLLSPLLVAMWSRMKIIKVLVYALHAPTLNFVQMYLFIFCEDAKILRTVFARFEVRHKFLQLISFHDFETILQSKFFRKTQKRNELRTSVVND